jgi:hypothetical protein
MTSLRDQVETEGELLALVETTLDKYTKRD